MTLTGTQGEDRSNRRGHRPDRLGEALGWARNQLLVSQAGSSDPGREQSEGTEARAGGNPEPETDGHHW